MTLFDNFTLNSVFAQYVYNFCVDYLKTIALKVITVDGSGTHTISSKNVQHGLSFWLYRGIRFMRILARFTNFYVNFPYIYVCLSPDAVLVKDQFTRTVSALGTMVGTVSFAWACK